MFKNRRLVLFTAALLLVAAALIVGARTSGAVVVYNRGGSSNYASQHPYAVIAGSDLITPDTPGSVQRDAPARLSAPSATPDLCEWGRRPSWICDR